MPRLPVGLPDYSNVERYPCGRFPGGPEAPWLEPLAAISGVTELSAGAVTRRRVEPRTRPPGRRCRTGTS